LELPKEIEAQEDAGLTGGHLQEVGYGESGLLLSLPEGPGFKGAIAALGSTLGEAGLVVGIGAIGTDEGIEHGITSGLAKRSFAR